MLSPKATCDHWQAMGTMILGGGVCSPVGAAPTAGGELGLLWMPSSDAAGPSLLLQPVPPLPVAVGSPKQGLGNAWEPKTCLPLIFHALVRNWRTSPGAPGNAGELLALSLGSALARSLGGAELLGVPKAKACSWRRLGGLARCLGLLSCPWCGGKRSLGDAGRILCVGRCLKICHWG